MTERHNYNLKCEEDEFMVAADFTLYSNPINRALYRPPTSSSSSKQSNADKPETDQPEKQDNCRKEVPGGTKEAGKEDEWIASDMTKYDSPLAELERQGRDRDAEMAQIEKAATAAAASDERPTSDAAAGGAINAGDE